MCAYVLSHVHNGALFSEQLSHLADLLGGDIIDLNEQGLAVLDGVFLSVSPDLVLSVVLV